ncbi:MAG TPA: hypothetical protein VGL72_32005, partial [Bryobacteraceae bacterium]
GRKSAKRDNVLVNLIGFLFLIFLTGMVVTLPRNLIPSVEVTFGEYILEEFSRQPISGKCARQLMRM